MQGSCDACWAITAVETIELAYVTATGNLINLAEEEVIACDGTCMMCNGGWPQNTYENVMKHNGLPALLTDYGADWLYTITALLAGESDEASEFEMGYFRGRFCWSSQREGRRPPSGPDRSRHRSTQMGRPVGLVVPSVQ